MNEKIIKYFKSEISFFVPDCSGKNRENCSLCNWAKKRGFICTFSDSPYNGRWFVLVESLKNAKARKISTFLNSIKKHCVKCK